jgi:hypothetical protein
MIIFKIIFFSLTLILGFITNKLKRWRNIRENIFPILSILRRSLGKIKSKVNKLINHTFFKFLALMDNLPARAFIKFNQVNFKVSIDHEINSDDLKLFLVSLDSKFHHFYNRFGNIFNLFLNILSIF